MSNRYPPLSACILAIALLALGACKPESASDPAAAGPVALTLGPARIQVELALSQAQMARGLMFRDSLPTDQGMLFIYEQPTQMSFWMRNTRIPLDIGFFTPDGQLREVHALYPYDETSVKSIRADLLFALEMNQGWYARNGVKPGARLDLDTLRRTVSERGRTPNF